MNIHGWKQLAEWSIEHSCLSEEEKARGLEIFRQEFEAFCQWIVEAYGEVANALPSLGEEALWEC